MVVDMRRSERVYQPLLIRDAEVEFLGVHICEDLKWTENTVKLVSKANQRMYFLRRLFDMSPQILHNFYRCTVESVLTCCLAVWFGNSTTHDRKALQRVIKLAWEVTGTDLPSLQDIYNKRICKWACNIIKDTTHPIHNFFTLMKSGKWYWSTVARTVYIPRALD